MSNANLAAIVSTWTTVGPAQEYTTEKSLNVAGELGDDDTFVFTLCQGDTTIKWNSLLDEYPTLAGQFYDRVCFSSRSLVSK